MKLWRYLYFKSFSIHSRRDNPEIGAVFMMWYIFFLNVLTVKNIFAIITNQPDFLDDKLVVFTIAGLSFYLQYLFFIKEKRYKRILTEFKEETKRKSNFGYTLIILVNIVTVVLWYYTESIVSEMAVNSH